MVARAMVELLMTGVRTPVRPQTPQNSYLTEEDVFLQKNPQFVYDYTSVQTLKSLYMELFEEQDRPNHAWNLSIDDLKAVINSL
jgi:hypothetical protein